MIGISIAAQLSHLTSQATMHIPPRRDSSTFCTGMLDSLQSSLPAADVADASLQESQYVVMSRLTEPVTSHGHYQSTSAFILQTTDASLATCRGSSMPVELTLQCSIQVRGCHQEFEVASNGLRHLFENVTVEESTVFTIGMRVCALYSCVSSQVA